MCSVPVNASILAAISVGVDPPIFSPGDGAHDPWGPIGVEHMALGGKLSQDIL